MSKDIHDVIQTTIKGFATPHPEPEPEPEPKPQPELKPEPKIKKSDIYPAVKEVIVKLTGKKKTVPIKDIQKELGLSRTEMISLLDDIYSGKYGEEIEFNSVRNPGNRYLKPDSDESKDRGWKFAGSLSLISKSDPSEAEYLAAEVELKKNRNC